MDAQELFVLIWDTAPHLTSTVVEGDTCSVKRTWKPLDPTVEDGHLGITLEDIPTEDVWLGALGVTDIDIATQVIAYHLPVRVRTGGGSVPFTRQMALSVFAPTWK